MSLKRRLLGILADGKFHSGEDAAKILGVSRMAVWKQVQYLKKCGLEIRSYKRRGYSLAQPVELLEASRITSCLDENAQAGIRNIDINFQIDSTNSYLINKLPHEDIHGRIVLAEYQTGGRGSKADRKWISPLCAGIYMSIGWHFQAYPDSLTGLSLATGVAVSRALKKSGVGNIFLKWPNDIISAKGKLGGILVESRGIANSYCDVVIGIGVNFQLPDTERARINNPVVDIHSLTGDITSRNRLVGGILNQVFAMLGEFEVNGMENFISDWRSQDYFAGKEATLVLRDKTLQGTVLGILDNGQLQMSINGRKQQFSAGELSLRQIH